MPGKEVHHIIHLTAENVNDPYISLNENNLETLCRDCHQKEHRQDRAEGHRKHKDDNISNLRKDLDRNYIFDANGQLVPRA